MGFPIFITVSLLLHILLALALWFWPDPRKPSEQLPPPSFDVVFEGGAPQRSEAEPAEGSETEPQPPTPPGSAEVPAPPTPDVPPPPPVPQPPVPQNVPPPPVPQPPVRQATPMPPVPQPPLPAPTPQPPLQQAMPLPIPPPPAPPIPQPPDEPAPMPEMAGTVELFAPQTELRLPDRLSETLPPSVPQPPRPTPPRQASPAPSPQPRPNLPGMWMPNGVQLGQPSRPPSGRPQARGMDLSVDPRIIEGQAARDPSVRVSGAQVGADWRAAFRRWLDQNIRYSPDAIMRGEDGVVRVRVTASADGTVRNVQLVGPSTSPSLNHGTTWPFNGARLPAFPPGSEPVVTIDLTVNYVLIRR